MRTSLLFLLAYTLWAPSSAAGEGLVRSDTTRLARPDSATPVRPDSAHPEPSVSITGNIELMKNYLTLRNAETTQRQNSPWFLNGTLVLTTRSGWFIPIQGVWSSPASGYEQTYNAISISPRYKNWLTLHGGHQNLNVSPFTLAGHTIFGAGIELNPGLLRVGLMAGRFNKAVEVSETNPDQMASFQRTGYCARLGVGKDRTYLDVILLHVTDDAHSIRLDSAAWLTPAENTVLGLSGRMFTSRKITAEIDVAGSIYTSDTRAELPSATTTPASRRFKYMNYLNRFTNLTTVNASTTILTAVQASLNYRMNWADLSLRYKRVEPGYQSMGSYYQQSDVERITVAPAIRLFKSRLQLRSSVGWHHDNLLNQKRTRTDRFIGSMSLSYISENNLTLDLTASNYGTTQRAGARPLNDSTRLNQNNQSLTGSASKYWTTDTHTHSLNSSATYQALQNLNPFAPNRDQGQSWNYYLDYTMNQLANRLTLNMNYSYSRSSAPDLSFLVHGPSARVEKKVGSTRVLCVSVSASYLKSRQVFNDTPEQSTAFNTALTLDYQLTPVHQLSANGSVLVSQGAQRFRQQQGTILYTVSF